MNYIGSGLSRPISTHTPTVGGCLKWTPHDGHRSHHVEIHVRTASSKDASILTLIGQHSDIAHAASTNLCIRGLCRQGTNSMCSQWVRVGQAAVRIRCRIRLCLVNDIPRLLIGVPRFSYYFFYTVLERTLHTMICGFRREKGTEDVLAQHLANPLRLARMEVRREVSFPVGDPSSSYQG